MKRYEVVLLLDPAMKDADRAAVLKELEGALPSGAVESVDTIGLQTLSYDLARLRGNNRAFIVSYVFSLDAEGLLAVKKVLLYNKAILRYNIFAMNAQQEAFVFEKLVKEMEEAVAATEGKKFGQKATFFLSRKNHKYITWKAIPVLNKYVTRFGEIKPRKYTGNTVSVQKKIKQAISRARELWLLQYIK